MRISILGICMLFLIGCDNGVFWKDGDYVVYWMDTSDNVRLGIQRDNGDFVGRVSKQVLSVGSNHEYIVVKQLNNFEIRFFIINRLSDHELARVDAVVSGPFNENQFNTKKLELNLPEFSWKK